MTLDILVNFSSLHICLHRIKLRDFHDHLINQTIYHLKFEITGDIPQWSLLKLQKEELEVALPEASITRKVLKIIFMNVQN